MDDTTMQPLLDLISGIKVLGVPRAEDLPYWTSPPIQFVYESTAALAVGVYDWNDQPSALTPNRPILNNALYFFRSITLTADVEQLDYTSNIATSPAFYMFKESDSDAVMFREPILMNTFYQNFDYRFWWQSHRANDVLKAAFVGTLVQGAGLIGKTSITLKAIISAQEVVDEGFVNAFKMKYPTGGKS
jgi:hypothetical protein